MMATSDQPARLGRTDVMWQAPEARAASRKRWRHCWWWWCAPAALGILGAVLATFIRVATPDGSGSSSCGCNDADNANDDANDNAYSRLHLDLLKRGGSSMACDGADALRRTCAFKYLCFSPATGDFALVRPATPAIPEAAGEGDADDELPPLSPALSPLSGTALADERSRGAAHLSTVGEHAQHALQLVDVDGASLRAGQVVFFGGPTFVMRRFKPDNLMHALHDDLLPLFRELRKLLPSLRGRRTRPMSQPSTSDGASGREQQQQQQWRRHRFPFRLFFTDDYSGEQLEHDALYAAMSGRELLTQLDLLRPAQGGGGGGRDDGSSGYRLVCFEEAYAGFDRSTLWYQYGFESPQGPLPLSASVRDDLREFALYLGSAVAGGVWLRQRLEQPAGSSGSTSSAAAAAAAATSAAAAVSGGHVLLLCRRGNRLILNEDELALALARACSCRVRVAAAETHSLAELLSLARGARALVGVHGALLALAAFAPPGASLVELFPYALRPELYTPYARLADVAGLHYAAWRNVDRAGTRGHAGRAPELGGLGHLTSAERQLVLDAEEVAPHRCCSDASWLYHVYQDTVVDAAAVARLLTSALERSSEQWHGPLSPPPQQQPVAGCPAGVVPARPQAVACTLNGSRASVSWQAPWNVGGLGCGRGVAETYEVVWHGMDGQERSVAFVVGYGHGTRYDRRPPANVWVRLNDGAAVGLWSRYAACVSMPEIVA